MNQSSPTEPTVKFAHCWISNVHQSSSMIHENESFTTAFGLDYYKWEVGLFGYQINKDVKVTLNVNNDWIPGQTPINCLFTLAVKNPTTYQTILESELLVEPTLRTLPDEYGQNYLRASFKVPVNSEYGRKLNQIFSPNGEYMGFILEIATIIKMRKSSFSLPPWTELLPTTPLEPNQLTCGLYEEDRFNFSIRGSNNEEFRTRKDLLNAASRFFRYFFTSNSGRNAEFLLESQYSVHAIKTVVIYMLTGTFSAPPTWSPDMADQCMTLASKYNVLDVYKFASTVEWMCCEGLDKQPVDMIVKWLLVSGDHELDILQNATVALLLTVQSIPFQINYEGPNINPAGRKAVERLNLPIDDDDETILFSKLIRLRNGCRHVMALDVSE